MRLEAQDIVAGYAGKEVLQAVGIAVEQGEFVGLIGPNGCGKSTLLRVLSHVLKPRRGSVQLDGRPIAHWSSIEIAKRLAFVPQQETAAFDFTVRDVVLMGRYPHRARFHAPFHARFQGETERDYAQVHRALVQTDIVHLADRPVTRLSGGEHRRVLLARALAQQTPLLLLDEPVAHLDLAHQAALLRLVHRLTRPREPSIGEQAPPIGVQKPLIGEQAPSIGVQAPSIGALQETALGVQEPPIGALAALHDLNQAAEVCDRLVLLCAGRVIAEGDPDVVLTPANLRAAYEAHVQIGRNPITGKRILLSVQPACDVSAPPPMTAAQSHAPLSDLSEANPPAIRPTYLPEATVATMEAPRPAAAAPSVDAPLAACDVLKE